MTKSDKLGDVLPDEVHVTIGGKQYRCRFTFRSCAYLSKKYGTLKQAFDEFAKLGEFDSTEDSFERLTDFVYASVITDTQETRDEIESNLTMRDVGGLIETITKAFVDSMPRAQPTGVDELGANFPQNGTQPQAVPEKQNGTGPI